MLVGEVSTVFSLINCFGDLPVCVIDSGVGVDPGVGVIPVGDLSGVVDDPGGGDPQAGCAHKYC